MDPPLWNDGCFCYRDTEAEAARQLGFEVRCGGGLPCSCSLFNNDSFAPVDPLFNDDVTAPDEWSPIAAVDPLKQDLWPGEPVAPPPAPPLLQQPARKASKKRPAPGGGGKKKKGCCGCPCAKLHKAAAEKKKNCCGDDCKCMSGACGCPHDKVSEVGRCCKRLVLPGRLSPPPKPEVGAASGSLPVTALLQAGTPLTDSRGSSISNPDRPILPSLGAMPLSNGIDVGPSFAPVLTTTVLPPFNTMPAPLKRQRTPAVDGTAGSYSSRTPVSVPQPQIMHLPLLPIHSALLGVKAEPASAVTASPPPSSVFRCGDCSLTFTSQRALESHSAKKHKKSRPYKCNTCSASFLFKQNRDRHIVEVHDGKRPHQCPHAGCGAAFKNSSGLKQHTRTVHDKQRPFKCDQCTSSFGQRNHLTQHIVVVHLRRKNFRCTVCGTSFSNRGNLNQHVRRKHAGQPTTSLANTAPAPANAVG